MLLAGYRLPKTESDKKQSAIPDMRSFAMQQRGMFMGGFHKR